MGRRARIGAWWVHPAVAFLVYVATALVGFVLEPDRMRALPVYLAPGVAIAVLARWGTPLWPAVCAGAFAVGLLRGLPAETSLLMAVSVSLQAIVACHALAWVDFRPDLSRLRDALGLIALGAVASPLVSAVLFAVGLPFLHPDLRVVSEVLRLWLGTAIGILITVPPIVMWTAERTSHRRPARHRPLESALLFLVLVLACEATFSGTLGTGHGSYPLAFLPYPILLWIGLRLGPLALVTATSLVSFAALYHRAQGTGPLATVVAADSAAIDWIFLAVTQVTFLTLAAVLAERATAERALRAEKERAESATRAKSEFLSAINHEMRTPLNSILLAVDLLLESELSRDQRELGHTVHRAGEALRTLVSDTLDLARIEEGRLEILTGEFSPRDLSHGVIGVFAAAARGQRVALHETLDPELPAILRGDAARIRQVLINLVGNALKFTPQGRIELRTVCRARSPGLVRVRWEVADSGIGVPEEDRSRIFDRFTQLDASLARKHSGTGLGLAICRRLVELMGGEIGVESEVGHGSLFWVSIPLTPGTDAAARRTGDEREPASRTAAL